MLKIEKEKMIISQNYTSDIFFLGTHKIVPVLIVINQCH